MAILMLMIVASLSVASCNKDDEPKSEKSLLVGTWKAFDSDGDQWILTLSSNNTGYISLTYNTRVSITISENFSWNISSDSAGNKFLDIIHTSGDDILGTGSYIYIVAGDKLSFGGMVFSK